jgi:hypothetical protein
LAFSPFTAIPEHFLANEWEWGQNAGRWGQQTAMEWTRSIIGLELSKGGKRDIQLRMDKISDKMVKIKCLKVRGIVACGRILDLRQTWVGDLLPKSKRKMANL